ncbi:TCR/Tet family MFS transporter [Primorskyibacter sp. S87]|uniref:TCR/Tet family MFS transporter n=1 Tax=Primorskyibacter sp. S87 TaxID=3415126 RepID=UPI003C79FD00
MKLPVVFILITVMLDAMGIGLIMPIMPSLIREVQGGDLANAALWGGVLSTVFAVMQFLFSPVLGNLSDYLGRRPVMLVSLAVMALDYLVMAIAGSIWLLLLGRVVGGITAATHTTATAYMADISEPSKKAANFGLVGAAFGVGFVLGPILGGVLGGFGTRAPFYAAAILSGANFLLGLFVMRETVTDVIRRPFYWRRANPLGAFRAVSSLPGVRELLWVYFLYSVALYVYPAIWSYFTEARFGWSPQVIGLSLALFGLTMALVQGVLIRIVLHRFGEARTVLLGLGADFLAFGMLTVVTSGAVALLLTPVAALGAVVAPAIQAMMSRAVPDNQQGELLGVVNSVHALSMIVSPLMMASVFSAFAGADARFYLPGAPFALSMLLLLLAAAIFIHSIRAKTVP